MAIAARAKDDSQNKHKNILRQMKQGDMRPRKCPSPPIKFLFKQENKETSFSAEKRYWRLRRLESAVPAQLALKNVTLRKGRDTLCKVRQSGTCCAEREQPICTASRWQLMESLSGTAVSSTVAIVGSIWPKGPAQAGPAIQAQ